MIYMFVIFLITYLICSINPAIVISKKVIGVDIREVGSGNAGTTNSLRVMGKFWGAVVFLCDILKVVVAFYICSFIAIVFKQDLGILLKSPYIVGAVIGHCYPIYYEFKGGKGMVAVLVSSFFISPQITMVCLIVALVIIVVTRMVSLGSVCAVALYAIMTLVMQTGYIVPVLIVSVIILFKHKENIKRIMNKEEHKIFS